MPTKKLKIIFYVLIVGLSLLLLSAIALRMWVHYRPAQSINDNLYSAIYVVAITSMYISTGALFFMVYFMFKAKNKKK